MSGSYYSSPQIQTIFVPADAYPAVIGLLTAELASDQSIAVGVLHPALPGPSAPFVQFGSINPIEPHCNASATCCNLDSV